MSDNIMNVQTPDGQDQSLVRIHIDREPYDAHSPTSGHALYHMGDVREGEDLFREAHGGQEDQLVPRHAHDILLTADEHFYSQKVFTIAVNTEDKEVTKRSLSFDDLVRLAGDLPADEGNVKITIDYSNGPRQNPQGRLKKGQSVLIRNGMEFDVAATDRS